MALRVGAILREARAAHPETFREWVETELPFGTDTARRLMAISEAYEKLPADKLAMLPRPWQALYALRALSPDELQQAMEAGEITPDMSERAAKGLARRWRTGSSGALTSTGRHHRADIAAGALMEFSPADVNPHVMRALQRWMRQ